MWGLVRWTVCSIYSLRLCCRNNLLLIIACWVGHEREDGRVDVGGIGPDGRPSIERPPGRPTRQPNSAPNINTLLPANLPTCQHHMTVTTDQRPNDQPQYEPERVSVRPVSPPVRGPVWTSLWGEQR